MIGRAIIALLFIPFFVWLVLLENSFYYNILIALSLFTGLLEYSGMFKKAGIKIFTVVNALFLVAALFGMAQFRIQELNETLIYKSFTLIIIYAAAITAFSLFAKDIKVGMHRLVFSFFAVFYIVLLGSSLFFVRNIGPCKTLFLFAVVWIYDSGAYFVGSRFGRHKLSPLISPKKSIEGVFGGIFAALLVITVFKYISFTSKLVPYDNLLYVYFLVVVLSLAAQAGDLLESLLKRYCGVKDSSDVLLGHGGVLDKLDSFLIATPVYLLLAVLK